MIRLSDDARRLAALFEEETDAIVRDCIIDEEYDRVIFLVKAGQMGQAIGTDGERVSRVEERIGRDIKRCTTSRSARTTTGWPTSRLQRRIAGQRSAATVATSTLPALSRTATTTSTASS